MSDLLAASMATAVEANAVLAGQGSVTVDAPTAADVVVHLVSSKPSEAAVPATVTILSGAASASFDITTFDDAFIDGSQVVVISAHVQNWADGTGTIEVIDDENTAITVSIPATAVEGQAVNGSITIDGLLTADLPVSLVSGDSSEVTVPPTLVLQAGQTSVSFPLTIPDDTECDGTQHATVTASAQGFTDGAAGIDVLDNDVHHFVFSNIATPQKAGVSFSVTITAQDVNGILISSYSGTAVLSAQGDSGTAVVEPAQTTAFGNGTWTGQIAVKSLDSNVTLTAGTGDRTGTSNAFNMLPGPLHHFEWATVASPQEVNVPFATTLTAKDSCNFTATDFNGTVSLAGHTGDVESCTMLPSMSHTDAGSGSYTLGHVFTPSSSIIITHVRHYFGSKVSIWKDSGELLVSVPVTSSAGTWKETALPQPLTLQAGQKYRLGVYTSQSYYWRTDLSPGFAHGTINLRCETSGDGFPGSTYSLSAYWFVDVRYWAEPRQNTPIAPVSSTAFENGTWTGNVQVGQPAAGMRLLADDGTGRRGSSNAFDVTSLGSLTVVLPSRASEGNVVQGTVSTPNAPEVDLAVSLASGTPSLIAVPATAVIPAGQTSAAFDLTVADNSLLDGTRSAAVTASAPRYVDGSATIAIDDNETAVLTLTLPEAATEGQGTMTAAGTVHLSAAPDADVVVSLVSADPTEIQVPASVTISAGLTSAAFDLTLPDDTEIEDEQAVAVTAHVECWTDGTASVTVQDQESREIVVTLPMSVREGDAAVSGTVAISGTFATDLVVQLSCNDTTEAVVPESVTIPAGQTSASFSLSAVDDDAADGSQSATITATASGFTQGTDDTTVQDNEVHHFAFGQIASPCTAGVAFAVTLRAEDVNAELITTFGAAINFSAAGTAGVVDISPATADMTNGAWSGNLTVNGVDANVVVSAADTAGHTGTSNAFDVTFGPLHHFTWNALSSPQVTNTPIDATITAKDANGYTVTDFTGTVGISLAQVAGPVIIGTGTATWQYPMRTYYHDSRTQVIYLAQEIGGPCVINGLSLYVATKPGQTMNAWTIRIKHTALSNYGASPAWESSDWTIVYQKNESVAATGWCTFTFSNPFTYNGIDNLMVDFSHNNSSYTSDGYCQATSAVTTRSIYYYTDSGSGDPLSWSGTSPSPNTSSNYPNIKLSVTSVSPSLVRPSVSGSFVAGVWSGSLLIDAEGYMGLSADDGSGHTGSSGPFTLNSSGRLQLVTPESATEGDALSAAGVVTAPTAPPGDLAIQLDADPAGILILPASVVLHGGEAAVVFDMAVADGPALDGTRTVTVRAAAPGYISCSTCTTVYDNESAALSLALPPSANEGDGVLPGQGTVEISTLPDVDVSVRLTSSDTSELVVPDTVTIPAGQSSATFPLTLIDDTAIDGPQTVLVTAHVYNWTDGTCTVQVLDNEARTLAVSLPASRYEGTGTVAAGGRVTITGKLAVPLVVSLSSSDTSEVSVPATVTIPAQKTSATFDVTVMDDDEFDGVEPVTIWAECAGFAGGSAAMSVLDSDVHHLTVSSIASPRVAGVPFSVTISARDVDDAEISAFTGSVSLSAAGDGGAIPVSPAQSGSFSSGRWTGSVSAGAVATNVILTARDAAGRTGASNAFNVEPGPLHHFTWDTIASPQYVQMPFGVTLRAQDANGCNVTSFTGSVNLTAMQGVSTKTVGAGTSGWSNPMCASYQDARTQVIYLAGEIGGPRRIAGLALNVQTAPGRTLPAWTIRMKHTSKASYSGSGTSLWETTGWTTVYQKDETVTSTGWVWFTFSQPFEYDGVANLMIDFSFNGSTTAPTGYCYRTSTSTRSVYYYTDSAYGDPLAWGGSGSPSPYKDSYIPNVQFLTGSPVAIEPTVSGSFVNGVWTGSLAVLQPAAGVQLGVALPSSLSNAFDVTSLGTLALSIPGTAAEGDGSVGASVSVSEASANDILVSLSSNDTTEAAVPAAVTIPAGETSAAFSIAIIDDDGLDGTKQPGVSASAAGYLPAAATMAVRDNEAAVLSVTVPPAQSEGDGVLTQAGLVTMNLPATDDVTVELASNDLTELTVPQSTTIPAGATEASFDLSIIDDADIDGNQTAAVTAHVDGWTDGSAPLAVADNDATLSVTVPANSREGEGLLKLAGTVQLGGATLVDLPVLLSVDLPDELVVPSAVIVPAHESSASFDLVVWDDAEYDGAQTASVTARADGFLDASDTIAIADNDVFQFVFTDQITAKTASVPFTARIEACDVNGVLIPQFAGSAGLTAADPGGDVPIAPASVSFTAGYASPSVKVLRPASSVVLSVRDSSGRTGSSNSFDVVHGPLHHFTWDSITGPQYVDRPFDVRIAAQDANGHGATSFSGPVALAAFSGSGEKIIGTGTSKSTLPMYSSYHDARTQVIYLASEIGGRRTITGLSLDVATKPGQMLKGWTIRMKHTAKTYYSGSGSSLWESSGWTTVYQNDETVTSTGWVLFSFSQPFEYDGTSNLIIDFSFNGSTTSTDGYCRYTSSGSARSVYYYTNSSYDDPLAWSSSSGPYPYTTSYVPNVRLSFGEPVPIEPAEAEFAAGMWAGSLTVLKAGTGICLKASASVQGFSNAFDVVYVGNLTITLPSAVNEGDGTLAGQGSVGVSPAPETALTVHLASDDPTELAVPETVVIPAGETSASFDLAVVDDSDLDGTCTAAVSAASPSYSAGNAAIAVHDNESALLAVALPERATEGGGTLAGTVSVSSAPAVDVLVALMSSDTSEVAVPQSMTIPAGETSATFILTFPNDGEIDGSIAVAVAAHVQNWTIAPVQDVVISPTVSGEFTAGVWSGNLTISTEASNVTLKAVGGGFTGSSNLFDVVSLGPLTLALPVSVVEGDSVQGTVSVPAAPAADLIVSLSSDDATEVTLPESVTISAGAQSVTFDLTIPDDMEIDGTRTAAVTAAAAGYVGASAAIAVHDSETATITLTIPGTASEGDGQLAEQCVVRIDAPPAADVRVLLASSDSLEVTVPEAVIVPAGQLSAEFPIVVVDDTEIDGIQTVTISATVQNWTGGSATISVLDNEALTLTVVLPDAVDEGAGIVRGAGSVTLAGTTPVSIVVSLASGNPGELVVPSAVIIPAGEASAAFDLVVWENALCDGSREISVAATAASFAGGEATTTITDNDLHHVGLSIVASPQLGGAAFGLTISALDVQGATIGSINGTCNLTVAGDGGAVALQPATAALQAGQITVQARVNTIASNVVITAAIAGRSGTSNPFNVVPGEAASINWDTIGSPQRVSQPIPATLTARDANGFTPAGYGASLALTGIIYNSPIGVIQNPSYETTSNWSTYDSYGAQARRSSAWASSGSYSFEASFSTSTGSGGYVYFRQDVDLTDAGALAFDYRTDAAQVLEARILVGGSLVWSVRPASGSGIVTRDVFVTLPAVVGTKTLELRVLAVQAPSASCSFFWDNLRTYGSPPAPVEVTPATAELAAGTWTGSITVGAPGYVRLIATGNGGAFVANSSFFAVLPESPAAPSDFRAGEKSTQQITWRWLDNSANEDGFRGSGLLDAQVWQTAAGADAFTEGSLLANKLYSRRLRAFNAGGDSQPVEAAAWTAIQPPAQLSAANATAHSIEVTCAGTFSNLTEGSSGLIIRNVTAATDSGWRQENSLWTSSGLTPNCEYAFAAKARNGAAEETQEQAATFCTLPLPPEATCDKSTGNPANPVNSSFTFTGTPAWGTGGVDHCHYAWQKSPAYSFAGSEPEWSGAALQMPADSPGMWYLHLQSHNPVHAAGGACSIGPFHVLDAPVLQSEPAYTPGTTNTITWDASAGADGYRAEYAVGDFGVPAGASGWFNGTTFTFNDLPADTTCCYRVQARAVIPGSQESWQQSSGAAFRQNGLTDTAVVGECVELALGPDAAAVDLTTDIRESFSGAARGRLQVFLCSDSATLRNIDARLDLAAATELTFVVYSAPALEGPYSLSTAKVIAGTAGATWHDSGNLSVELVAGSCYAIGAFWAGWADYYGNDDTPGPVSFGVQLGSMQCDSYPPGELAAAQPSTRNYCYRLTTVQERRAASGSVISAPITPLPLHAWGTIGLAIDVPQDTSLTVDVLDESSRVLITGVAPGADLAALGAAAGTIRLRANMATADPQATPRLQSWNVSWLKEPNVCIESQWSTPQCSMQKNILFVDDDAPGDPGPGSTALSDPAEDGSQAHPFDAIQEAISVATDGYEICVLDGTYRGTGTLPRQDAGDSLGARASILRARLPGEHRRATRRIHLRGRSCRLARRLHHHRRLGVAWRSHPLQQRIAHYQPQRPRRQRCMVRRRHRLHRCVAAHPPQHHRQQRRVARRRHLQ